MYATGLVLGSFEMTMQLVAFSSHFVEATKLQRCSHRAADAISMHGLLQHFLVIN